MVIKCHSLAGAVYGVWKNSSCSGEPFKRMTTDTNGHAKVDKLPFGNYWVKRKLRRPKDLSWILTYIQSV